ncbi:MAG: SUF system NifU family Fe-S cluster assembly protein [Candidatus Binatia bacterium]
MSDLRELYQATILDHSRQPKNFGKLAECTHKAEGYNPLCGDKVTVYLEIEEDRVKDIRFDGAGCAISTASASLMTEALKGKTLDEARALFRRVHETVTGQTDGAAGEGHPTVELGKLAVFEGVRQYPLRVKCATLAWHTLKNAMEGKGDDLVVTE